MTSLALNVFLASTCLPQLLIRKQWLRQTVASLLFFDASTLKIVAGPFELNQGDIEEISHLEFSPNDKFVFFGRLDKWFSVEKECVEDLPEFSKNSIIYEWGLFTPDGRCIVVKRNDFFHIPQTCQVKCCIVELLALWAVKEMDKSRDDERTCCFNSLRMPIGEIKSTKGGPTERLLERLQIDPSLHVDSRYVRSVRPYLLLLLQIQRTKRFKPRTILGSCTSAYH